ncbi:MAG: hypothetical protein V1704_02395 [Candidatus Vogelbacteria bacterium]
MEKVPQTKSKNERLEKAAQLFAELIVALVDETVEEKLKTKNVKIKNGEPK